MAEEIVKVANLLKRKRSKQGHPLPLDCTITNWLFFKRHILEKAEVRAAFEQQTPALDRAGFRRLVKAKANPAKFGPSACRRRSAKTSKRNTNDLLAALWPYYLALLHPDSPIYVRESGWAGGLGLYARRGTTMSAGKALFEASLWGVVIKVDDSAADLLQAMEYPSLYDKQAGKPRVMCGPLALVNHQCGARLAFSFPRQVASIEELTGRQAVYALSTSGPCRYRVAKDKEILVDYFSGSKPDKGAFAGQPCQCKACF